MKTQTFIKTLAALALIFALSSCKKSDTVPTSNSSVQSETPSAIQKIINPADEYVGDFVFDPTKPTVDVGHLEKVGDGYDFYSVGKDGKKRKNFQKVTAIDRAQIETLLGKPTMDIVDSNSAMLLETSKASMVMVKIKKDQVFKNNTFSGTLKSDYAIIAPMGIIKFLYKVK